MEMKSWVHLIMPWTHWSQYRSNQLKIHKFYELTRKLYWKHRKFCAGFFLKKSNAVSNSAQHQIFIHLSFEFLFARNIALPVEWINSYGIFWDLHTARLSFMNFVIETLNILSWNSHLNKHTKIFCINNRGKQRQNKNTSAEKNKLNFQSRK